MNPKIVKNKRYGYFEVEINPTQEDLDLYYSQKYYQGEGQKVNKYKPSYSKAEQRFINNKIEQKYYFAKQFLQVDKITSAIDIGCGEGHALNFFKNAGINTKGIDSSAFGISNYYPSLLPYFEQGNVLEVLDTLIQDGLKFQVIWLDNVLEHVIDPKKLLEQCYEVCESGGVLVVEVPNDFSRFQDFLKQKELVNRDYWVATPDHLNYFSPDSLTALCDSCGWLSKGQMTDFPIELFLLNQNSNYCENTNVGKGAHESRVMFSNYLKDNCKLEQVINMYQSMLSVGIGRQIIGIYGK